MDKKSYVNKFEEIIKDRIRKGVYETLRDTTITVSEKFNLSLVENLRNLSIMIK